MTALTCREVVELVTDYLEDALHPRTARGSTNTSRSARAATPT